jgi:hypothetical protein
MRFPMNEDYEPLPIDPEERWKIVVQRDEKLAELFEAEEDSRGRDEDDRYADMR